MKLRRSRRFRRARWSMFLVVLGALLLFSSMTIPPVAAASSSFQEDFTTGTYRDGAVSNVTGWGTGEISIFREPLTLAGGLWFPTLVMGVCIEGDIAYLAAYDGGLQVVNVSDPTNPFKIGEYNTPGIAYEVSVEGDLAFVADGQAGLQILNITNPAAPTYVGSCDTPQTAQEVYVEGDYAYVADGNSLQVIDISNPLTPFIAGVSDSYGGDAVFVSGDYCYTADGSAGLVVFDITDPTHPMFVSRRRTSFAYDVHISGNFAYVANTWDGLCVVNITDPHIPTIVSSIDTQNAKGVYVVGDFAYIADQDYGLQVVDISNPTSPELIGRFNTGAYTQDVWVSGEFAYLADEGGGLEIVKIAKIKSLSLEGNYPTSDRGWGLCVEGDYAFVTDVEFGLLVLNITNPTNPTLAGSYSTPDLAVDVAVAGNYAYITCYEAGLVVVNITDPSQPTWVSTCNTPGYSYEVFIEGNYAYVADETTGLQVIDISNPASPIIVDAYDTPDYAEGVFVEGDYAYIADYYSIQIIDISNPTSVSFVGSFATSSCDGVTIVGDYAYAANGNYGILILDITDPRNPTLAASQPTSYYAHKVTVEGNFLYISDESAGLLRMNITNPRNPILFDSIATNNFAMKTVVVGDYAYIADYWAGFTVVEIQQNLRRLFDGPGCAKSTMIFDSTSETVISATLTPIHTIPENTSITYSLSADNGANWEDVTPGVEHIFIHPGKQLMWRAFLKTNDTLLAPIISNLTISYNTIMDAPVLLTPSNTTLTGNNQPTFEWQAVSGATDYLLQIDIARTFNTPWLINVTLGDVTYLPSSPLSDGVWYWQVAAIDNDGVLGLFSPSWILEIDTSAPVWDEIPENNDLEFGTDFRYDLNATDSASISKWWINDNIHFAIDIDGLITNIVQLPVADYGLQVWVNDTLGNILTDEFILTVHDTASPTWDQIPTDQILECSEYFIYNLNATDLSGMGIWWINDTVHFAVDGNGVITLVGVVPCGQYSVEVRAYDIYNNPCYGYFTVTVEDTLGPTWIAPPSNQLLEFGESLDYQLQVTDPSGIHYCECNDTVYFAIDSTGRLTNITPLAVGTYGISVKIYDPYDNELTDTFSVIVQEVTTTTTTTTTTTDTEFPPDLMNLIIIGGLGGIVIIIVIIIIMRKK